MLTLASVVLAFVLTGVVGNHLIHALQHRNWVSQQRVLGLQKDYDALRALFDEISQLTGKRLARMHRLALAANSAELQRVEELTREYDDVLREWNEKLNNLSARCTFYDDYWMTQRLHEDVQASFYLAGRSIEALVRIRRAGGRIDNRMWNEALAELVNTQATLTNFNRDMLRTVKALQVKTFDGEKVAFSEQRLDDFSTWQLFKALFKRAEEDFTIVRSPSDLERPLSGG